MAADPNALPVQGPATVGNPLPVTIQSGTPVTTPAAAVQASSATAAAANTATLVSVAAKTCFVAGVAVQYGGATAQAIGTLVISGLLGGSMTIPVVAPAGVTIQNAPIVLLFNPPLPASAANINIVATLSSPGAGNVLAGVAIWGFNQ